MLLLWLNTLTTELKRRGTLIRAYQMLPSRAGTCLILQTEIGPDPRLEGIGTSEFSLAAPRTMPGSFAKRLKLNSHVNSLFSSHLPCPAPQNLAEGGRAPEKKEKKSTNLVLPYCIGRQALLLGGEKVRALRAMQRELWAVWAAIRGRAGCLGCWLWFCCRGGGCPRSFQNSQWCVWKHQRAISSRCSAAH